MALTKPRIGQLNTSVSASSDPITVLNQGSTTANADVGFLFNRANGLVSNVALYWSESANSFVTSFTSNSGVTNSNISPSSYANLTIGSLLSINGNIYLNGVAGTNGQYITQTSTGTSWVTTGGFDGGYVVNQSTFGSNLIAASATTSTSTTTGALVVVGGAGIAGTLYSYSLNTGAVTSSGTIIASTVNAGTIGNISANHVGTGTYLTSLNATNLSSGTVASAQISGSYTGITGVGALAAGSITTGFTTIPVAQGGTGVTSSTGSGNNVLSTSPTLVTPVLGTPASGTVTNLTGTASININGTVGATTPAAGAFTTLSATNGLTVTKSSNTAALITQTGATGYGLVIVPGADTVYDAFGINNAANTLNQIRMYGNGTATFAGGVGIGGAASPGSTGLAVTGALSATGKLSLSKADAADLFNITASTGTNGAYQTFTNTGGTTYVGMDSSTGAALGFGNYYSGVYAPVAFAVNVVGTNRGVFSSTGLAVTGTLSATGTITPSIDIQFGAGGTSFYNNQILRHTNNVFYIQGGTSGIQLNRDSSRLDTIDIGSTANQIDVQTNGVTRTRTTNSGLAITGCASVGAATPSTSGAGITFPATQNGSSNANTLDDYEEGTWTPNVNGASVGSFSTKTGYYVKTGKQVTCWFVCDGGNTGAGGATQYVTNLPFNITTAINNSIMGQMGVNGPATRTLDLMALNANFGVAYVYTGGSQEQTAISFASGCFTYGID